MNYRVALFVILCHRAKTSLSRPSIGGSCSVEHCTTLMCGSLEVEGITNMYDVYAIGKVFMSLNLPPKEPVNKDEIDAL